MRLLIIVLCFYSNIQAASLHVYAAASLTEVMQKVAKTFSEEHNIVFNFDASSKLAHQINSGAPADVYISANQEWMDFLIKNNRIKNDSQYQLLTNSLVLITAAKSKKTAANLEALTDNGFTKIALGGEAVPAGKFARMAISSSNIDFKKIEAKVVNADNVKVALKWVELGEADIGIVYKTDAISNPKVKILHAIDQNLHTKVIYPIGIVKKSKQFSLAQKFLAFCKSEKAKEIFKRAGFTTL